MISRRATLTLALRTGLIGLTGISQAVLPVTQAQTAPPAPTPPDATAQQRMTSWLGRTPRLVGQHRFTYWGFEVYEASLWASAPFAPEDWSKHALVLELRYLRDFKGTDIAQRSMDEIQGQRALNAAQTQNWASVLHTLIPNVRRGERLTGVYSPGKGLQLLHQDHPVGEVADTELAQRFFGIWLAPETSQRQLRQQLLAGARP